MNQRTTGRLRRASVQLEDSVEVVAAAVGEDSADASEVKSRTYGKARQSDKTRTPEDRVLLTAQ
jgi:hypothetical protein